MRGKMGGGPSGTTMAKSLAEASAGDFFVGKLIENNKYNKHNCLALDGLVLVVLVVLLLNCG